ncbi:MAG: alpha/beta fold hydrolase [Vicinamibacteria bacterium]
MAFAPQPAAAPKRARRWTRWLKRIAVGLVVLLIAFVFGFAPWWLGTLVTKRRFVYNDRENGGLTPASFSLPFDDAKFNGPDGTPLEGWWVPVADAKGTVVLAHGLNRSRIEMVKKLPFLQAQGWNALLFDMRNHGTSGGTARTFGWLEKGDLHAATAWVRAKSAGPVVLWGVSAGGAASTLAAAEDASVAGLVCDSSYRSLRDTVRHHIGLAREWRAWMRIVPSWPVTSEVLFWIGRAGHFDPELVDVEAAAGRLRGRPALFVCNSGDRRMPQQIAFDLSKAAGDHAHVLVVPGNSHGGAWRDGTAAYESAVKVVLQEAAESTRTASGGQSEPRVASTPERSQP